MPAPEEDDEYYLGPGDPVDPLLRLAAFWIDYLALAGAFALADRAARALGAEPRAALGAWAALGALYFLACFAGPGKTLGLACVGARVVRADGSAAGLPRAALRLLGLLLSAGTAGLAAAPAFGDRRRRGLADRVAGTQVVEDPGLVPWAQTFLLCAGLAGLGLPLAFDPWGFTEPVRALLGLDARARVGAPDHPLEPPFPEPAQPLPPLAAPADDGLREYLERIDALSAEFTEPDPPPSPRAAALLAYHMVADDAADRARARRVLARFGPSFAKDLREALAGPDPWARMGAAAALGAGAAPDPESARLLRALLSDPQPEVRHMAAAALASPRAPELNPALLHALASGARPARLAAARAAARFGGEVDGLARPWPEEMDEGLGALLSDDSVELRREAALSLLALCDRSCLIGDARRALAAAASDPDGRVRRLAAMSSARLEPGALPLVPVLIEALAGEDGFERAQAARSLARMGGNAKAAVAALRARLADPFPDARDAAAIALLSIDPGLREPIAALREAAARGPYRAEAAALIEKLGLARLRGLGDPAAPLSRIEPPPVPPPPARLIVLGEYRANLAQGEPRLLVMNPDGTAARPLVSGPRGAALAAGLDILADTGELFWNSGGTILSGDLSGDPPAVAFRTGEQARGLALYAPDRALFYSEGARILTAPLDGGDPVALLECSELCGWPTVDPVNRKLYYGDFGRRQIRRAELDGTENELVLSEGVEQALSIALDLQRGALYWADAQTTTNFIARHDLRTRETRVLARGAPGSSGLGQLRLDAARERLYWADELGEGERGLWTAGLDGGGKRRLYASPEGWNATGLALWTR